MAVLLPEGKQSFTTNGSLPLAGGKVYTYLPGTSTPKDTYTTSAGSVANTNPVILDSRGEATIFWSGAYDVVLKDSADVTIWGPIRHETPEIAGAAADVLADLADTSSTANGDALIAVKRTATAAIATTLHAWLETQPVNAITDYGAVADGVADDTAAIQALFDSGESQIYIPAGTYKITGGHIVIPSTVKRISGDGMGITILTTSKAQTGDFVADSLLYATTLSGCVIEDLTLTYTGTFDTGGSYTGYTSGIYFAGTSGSIANCTIQRVEANGWNHNGIYVGGADNLTVQNCYAHDNRVVGLGFGSNSGTRVLSNFCSGNGLVTDGGTGYGISFFSGTSSSNTLIDGNRTFRNFRKGIDVHDGLNFTIVNNQCTQDRLYAISIENGTTALNYLLISNNQIRVDKSFYLNADPYQYFYGIAVYINPYSDATANTSVPVIDINNNQINDIGTDNATGEVYGVLLTTITAGKISSSITDNSISGTFATIPFNISIAGATTKAITNISRNRIIVDEVDTKLIQCVFGNSSHEFNVHSNTFLVTTFNGAEYVIYDDAAIYASGNRINGNDLVIPASRATGAGANGGISRFSVTSALTASVSKNLARLAVQGDIGLYRVLWSAYRRTTGPAVTHVAGGELQFVCGYDDDNAQTPASSITAVATSTSGTLSLTWALTQSTTDNHAYVISTTASHDCTVFVHVERASCRDATTSARLNSIL